MPSRQEALRAACASPLAFFTAAVGHRPDAWQERVLRATEKKICLVASRQGGKSTVSACLALYEALMRPPAMVLVISPSDRQSAELLKKCKSMLRKLPFRVKLRSEAQRSLETAEGSRIVSLPSSEHTIRGFSAVTLLIEDEAGDVSDELFTATRPMLIVSGGRHMLLGTPKGRRGHFFDIAEGALKDDDWLRISVPAQDIARISKEELAAEKRRLVDTYPQEYECSFLAGLHGRVYGHYDPLKSDVEEAPKCQYTILGLDYGFDDACGFSVIGWNEDSPTTYVLESYKVSGLLAGNAAAEAKALCEKYQSVQVVGDTGGFGKGYAEEARQRFGVPVEPAQKTNKRGYIELLNGALEQGHLKLVRGKTEQLRKEWLELPWDDKREKERSGFANHAADATLYAWRASTSYNPVPEDEARPEVNTARYFFREQERMIASMEKRWRRNREEERTWPFDDELGDPHTYPFDIAARDLQ